MNNHDGIRGGSAFFPSFPHLKLNTSSTSTAKHKIRKKHFFGDTLGNLMIDAFHFDSQSELAPLFSLWWSGFRVVKRPRPFENCQQLSREGRMWESGRTLESVLFKLEIFTSSCFFYSTFDSLLR
uniref:(northern house mosquito) hypothetical protein n=1 Tax=Culex pipiens TaxID=7175 RepID=A0A8D8HGT4_CULPI